MITTSSHIDQQELFCRVWRHCREQTCHPRCGGDCSLCQPANWVLALILDLVASESEKPVRDLVPSIRRILEESRFVGEGGDLSISNQPLPPLDRQVELVVRTLEQMKLASRTLEGIWSNLDGPVKSKDANGQTTINRLGP